MSAISAAAPAAVSQEFYEPQRLQVYALVKEATGLVNDVSALVADYAIHLDIFGLAEWKRYFNQDVGEEPPLPEAFWKFWRSPDPAVPAQKVWETHLPPVLRPEFVIDMDTKARRDFCLTVMGDLMQKPKEGHATKYYCANTTLGLRQHGRNEVGAACWLVMRKDGLGRSQEYAQQIVTINTLNAGYEAGPSAVDLVTVVFTRFVVTQERYLGDETGIEARLTYSRCKETVTTMEDEIYQLTVGVFDPQNLVVSDDDPDNYPEDIFVIAALKKFPVKETQ